MQKYVIIKLYDYVLIKPKGGFPMPQPVDMTAHQQQVLQWIKSPEYQQACLHFQAECSRLIGIAGQLLKSVSQLQEKSETQTVRREFASGSTLHRGFYCPSPVFELIVGNTKRGKLLKRVTSFSKPSHEYGFDGKGRLLWCKTHLNGTGASYTEYLDHREHSVFGITLDNSGHPTTITEEVYHNGRLVCYTNVLCLPFGDSLRCAEIRCECYNYDELGLHSCKTHHYHPLSQNMPVTPAPLSPSGMPGSIYSTDRYVFDRRDGYLVSYTNNRGDTYHPRILRKA